MFERANLGIVKGYEHLAERKTIQCCDEWLKAWESVKMLMTRTGIETIPELEDAWTWGQYLLNYVQDLEMELGNAGTEEPKYYRTRIAYCWELLDRASDDADDLLVQNTRRAIAESHAHLGETDESDRLFEGWLQENPLWGWGWIGWADCYWWIVKSAEALEKAKTIISRGLATEGVGDKKDILDRAILIYQDAGDTEHSQLLKQELESLVESERALLTKKPIRVPSKIGRNEPCPCGSGKKYKNCCGRPW